MGERGHVRRLIGRSDPSTDRRTSGGSGDSLSIHRTNQCCQTETSRGMGFEPTLPMPRRISYRTQESIGLVRNHAATPDEVRDMALHLHRFIFFPVFLVSAFAQMTASPGWSTSPPLPRTPTKLRRASRESSASPMCHLVHDLVHRHSKRHI